MDFSSGRVMGLKAAGLAALASAAAPAPAVTLPIPCAASACVNSKFNASQFVSAGQATAVQAGSKLTVNQTTNNATLNWQSFNISADGTVQFVQPNGTSVALNQINDANATQIFGALNANGRVFLINQNGIIFGAGAQVSVGGLTASTLNIDPTAASKGLIASISNNNTPAFAAFSSGTTGDVTVSQGATLQTSEGGQILIFAPNVTNQGTISSPGGQTMLAAGSTIYLASNSDPSLRGLVVAVGGAGGVVTNGAAANSSAATPQQLVGQIIAERGDVTLAGLAVNQLGRVSATTSINENGTIHLQASDHGSITPGGVGINPTVSGTGQQLTLGAHSDSEVTLDSADPSTTVDSVPQLKSAVVMTGSNVQILNDSVVRATSGEIAVTASKSGTVGGADPASDGSRVYVAPGADLDVSGASIVLPVSSNVISVQLRGTELANSPLQQNGPLRSQTVYVDIRQGTPLADVSGEIAAIGHNVIERNLSGGTVNIQSQGDAILAAGSIVDVAGGQIQYTAGFLNTTKLLTTTGQIVDIGAANPNLTYSGIVTTTTVSDPKFGVTNTYQSTPLQMAPGYVEGKDAGTLVLSAPQFIFDGSVNTATAAGLYQRQPDQAVPEGALYRGYTQVPKAATLVIGDSSGASSSNNFLTGDLSIGSGLVLPGLLNTDGSAFDPTANTPLPASYTASVLRPELLGSTGFGNVALYTNGKFVEPASIALQFPAGGSFAATANVIDIEGRIDVPGGSITATAGLTELGNSDVQFGLILGPQAALTARGEWVNDNPLLYPNGNVAPLIINGGTVSLSAASTIETYNPGLALEPGSLIDVSGGAQLTRTGTVNAGTGGSIKVQGLVTAQVAGAPPRLVLGATLRGYGLYDGGSLTVTGGTICIAAGDCSAGDPTTIWISPGVLASGGFSAYTLNAGQGGAPNPSLNPAEGGLSVAPNTQVILQQQNLALPSHYQLLTNHDTLIGLSAITTLPDQLRSPVNLTLDQNLTPFANNGIASILGVTAATPSLSIGAGALIQADALANISLTSNARILEGGALRAPGGSISLSLVANQPEASYEPTQAIWLGSQGLLDVAGVAQIYPNRVGQRVGSVLPGGMVDISAERGFIELLPGSFIDVAGTAGVIDAQTGASGVPLRAEQIASAGGTVSLTAAEGVQMGGTFNAAAGIAGAGLAQPAGGSLSLTLDASNRSDYALASGTPSMPPFPNGARQIIVSATQAPVVVNPGYAVPDETAGNAYVSAAALAAGGFDSLSLKAAPLPLTSSTFIAGSIDFSGNVSLNAGRSISLDAATYSVSQGATARVQAPYVEFGNSDQRLQQDTPALSATAGTGTLNVTGGFIELYGSSALQGVGTARFSSSGDLRVRGILDLSNTSATLPTGALSIAGDLNLTAQQIYPSTLSQFVISADPSSVSAPTGGSILVQGISGSNTDLLSAGGALTLSAGSVTQNGVLRAPLGNISIDAQTITLGANSLTSTSANGLTIPFGTTQGGIDYVYPLPNGSPTGLDIVYGTDGITPPSQHVTLQGAQVNVNKGAVVDISGGGDLQAYEFISGPGGTNDVLSNSPDPSVGGRPNQFAILPNLQANVSPYDPNISQDTTLAMGDAVYLSGMPGLAAGVYQLLPSRYALLPGAYLVTPVSGYQDIQSGQSFPVLGGGTVISGYRTVAGTPFGDSRTSGFQVVPASVVLQQAEYTTTSANQFFASQAAQGAAQAAPGSAAAAAQIPRLPMDSGILALIASDALTLNGTLRTAAAVGGLGAEVDISSADILVASGPAPTQPGQILLTTGSLDALAAQTLLLGGLRSGNSIDTTAQSIEFASGANLTAPEILVAAQNQISVDGGAQISASGMAPGSSNYALTGDGAFLSVSAGAQSVLARSNPLNVAGVLNLARGSSINAPGGSVYLEASNNVVTSGALSLAGADLAVQAPSIVLGAAPTGAPGTVLGSEILAAQGLRSLLLTSSSELGLYGSLNTSAQNITLDAPGLAGFGAVGDTVTLSASKTFTFANSQNGSGAGAGAGAGALDISASNIIFSGGTLSTSGVATITLNAASAINATANGGLTTGGALNATASQITAGSNVSLALTAGGAASLLTPATPATPAMPAAAPGLGGSLAVTASSIEVGTQIVLPSGRVTLTTTDPGGVLALDSTATVSVAGLAQTYDGVAVATPGGLVSLSSAGNISLATGSTIDVSAGSGQGGTLTVSAPMGIASLGAVLKGGGGAGLGGVFNLDAQHFGDFAALNQSLNAGGFSGGRVLRLRGPGDLVVGAGAANAVTADNVSLEADQGGITVDGLIDASGARGGSVLLAASNDVTLSSGALIDAHATLAGQRGGTVQLETSAGQMLLEGGSTIDVSSGAGVGTGSGGSVLLRAPALTVEALLAGGNGVAIAGSIVGSSRTTLEAFNITKNMTGSISSADMSADPSNPIYAAAMTVVNDAAAISQALGQGSNKVFMVVPGVEIDSTVQSNGTGTLELDSPWNLYQWLAPLGNAPGILSNVPGILTLRAQNGVTFNASLSDGFATTSGTGAFLLPTQPTDSWSYRITAGADFTAASPLTVDAGNPPANVLIAACGGGTACQIGAGTGRRPAVYTPNMVRTGDGFIDVSASGDFQLGDQASLLYTAGVASSVGVPLPGGTGTLQGRAYPTGGGDIQINVGGDVVGAPSNQFVNAWLWRSGSTPDLPRSATAWTVDFQSFQQGVAALGGGNVSVTAGHDISDLGASIPSIGVQVGGTSFAHNAVQVQGGGILSVAAGGSIFGGTYYVGLGSLSLRAGDDVALSPATNLAPVIGLGDASVAVSARGDNQVSSILNPSLLARGLPQGTGATSPVIYFSTYGPSSSVSLTAIGGNVVLADDSVALGTQLGASFLGKGLTDSSNSANAAALTTLPPVLNAYAFGGDIDLSRTLALSPATNGNLTLFANQNIVSKNTNGLGAQLIVADADPTTLPTPDAPTRSLEIYFDIEQALGQALPDQHAPTPVFAAAEQSGALQPARLVALNGSVEFQPSGASTSTSGIWSAKPVHVLAGLDVSDLNLVAQNLSSADVTSVIAGRDILYPQTRLAGGSVLQDPNGIVVDGPGQLQVSAGRNVNLGTSSGLNSRANLLNPVLPELGAGISVEAGIGGGGPQFASFINTYVEGSSQFDGELIAFLQSLGTTSLMPTQAHQQFAALTPELQRTFVEQLFFDLLRTSGRQAAAKGNGDFSGAFAAIDSLFPGANPNLSKGETNAYTGDIALYFSRIYTEQGGNISLLAPGGQINVGLALAPISFGITKSPDELGIVAQTSGSVDAFDYGDFQVNASRVFAADGGDILIWSTQGNIDAGRGAKTAISAPSLNIAYDANGQPTTTLRAAIAGSGIQALAATPGILPGDVDLFAPHGVVNANDAGIVAGNLTIAATAVLGASNITVSGTTVGVPVIPTGLGAAAASASSAAGATSNVAESFNVANQAGGTTPLADAAIQFLEVFVTGLGEENCRPDDNECLKRERLKEAH